MLFPGIYFFCQDKKLVYNAWELSVTLYIEICLAAIFVSLDLRNTARFVSGVPEIPRSSAIFFAVFGRRWDVCHRT